MPPWDKVTSVWKNVQEVDLRPIRREAERRTTLALIGQAGSGRQALADLLRVDPSRPEAPIAAPVRLLDLDEQDPAAGADLALVLVQADQEDVSAEQRTVNRWIAAGKPVLVIINQPPSPGDKADRELDGLGHRAGHPGGAVTIRIFYSTPWPRRLLGCSPAASSRLAAIFPCCVCRSPSS